MRAPIERLTIWLAALVCLFVTASLRDVPFGGAPTPSLVEPAVAATGSLSVRVLESGGAKDGVRVRLFDGRAPTRGGLLADGVTTGGEVRFDALAPGGAWLVVEAQGFARQSRFVLVEGDNEEVEVSLGAAESFEVVVVDAAQRPIRHATVVVHGNDPLPTPGYTDPSGLAAFEALDTGPYAIEVLAAGFERKLLRELSPTQSPVFVKLEREAELIVHVVDPLGAAAGEATVLLAGSTVWPAKSLVTDGGGRAAFSGLPGGFYELRATRGATVSEVGEGVMLAPGEQREVEVHLVEGTFVEVFVTDGEGDPPAPLAAAEVALVEGGLSSFPVYGRSDDGGLAKLGPIVGGDATVSAEATGFVAKNGVPVEQGQGRVRVALLRAGKLDGRVVDERGYPIEGASLEVLGVGIDGMPIADSPERIGIHREHALVAAAGSSAFVPRGELGVMAAVPGVPLTSPDRAPPADAAPSRSSDGGLAPWVSRRDGTFALAPVTPGRVQLLVRHPRYVDTIAEPVTLAPGEHAEVTVVMRRGATLEGRVVEENRQPVAAARIELLTPDGAVERITFSAVDGAFAFTSVPADVVLAVARPEEPETIVEKLALEVPPDARRDVEIVLPRRREAVTFRVVDDRGFRLDRAEIAVSSLDPETALARTAFTDETGEARVAGARNLPLRLVVRRRGHAPLVTELERAPAELTLALAEEVSLEGEVRSRDGWLGGAAITLLFASGERHAKTDGGGRFAMGELARGPARLLVTAKGYAFEEKDIALEPDSRGRVQLPAIELSRGGALEGLVVDDRGLPVAGARVALGRVPTYLPAGPLPPGVTQTDGAGRFALVDLEAGDASVEAYKLGVGRASVGDLALRSGETTRDVRIELAAEPYALEESSAAATLAVTMSEHRPASRVALLLDHVPYGGEAQRAGLLAGDELTRIDGHGVASLEEARRRLDGPLSHDMVLELYRPKTGTYRVRVRREKLRP